METISHSTLTDLAIQSLTAEDYYDNIAQQLIDWCDDYISFNNPLIED